MSGFQPATIEAIAAVLPAGVSLTAREIEARLNVHFSRGTIRKVLRVLSDQGRAVIEGDITLRRYRFRSVTSPELAKCAD